MKYKKIEHNCQGKKDFLMWSKSKCSKTVVFCQNRAGGSVEYSFITSIKVIT